DAMRRPLLCAWYKNGNAAFFRGSDQGLVRSGIVAVTGQHKFPRRLLHTDQHQDTRSWRRPRRHAERPQRCVDLITIEVHDEVVGAITGALLVVGRKSGHSVMIVKGRDEGLRLGLEEPKARIIGQPRITGDLDQYIL